MDPRQNLINLAAERTQALNAAEAALTAGNTAEYDAQMERVSNMNTEMERYQRIVNEQQRRADAAVPGRAEYTDMASERGSILMRGEGISFSAQELRRMLNSTTLATGTLAEPTGAGAEVRDIPGNQVSSIIDQVFVQDLTGLGEFNEPYVVNEMAANADDIATLAGTARTPTDPTFGVAQIKPYEVNVTSYVDRNISKLTPARYFEKVRNMALTAMRRKVSTLIAAGDSETSHVMYGIINGKNKAGTAIYATEALGTAIGVGTLDQLYFAYGTDEAVGANARLFLTKANLKALGALRGTNEKRRLFEIIPDGPNTGIIKDGGLTIPYTICSGVGANTLVYGDPMNYELGLFGDFTVRVDESYKAGERLYTVLGDAMVGGNIIAHHGFVVGTISAASSS